MWIKKTFSFLISSCLLIVMCGKDPAATVGRPAEVPADKQLLLPVSSQPVSDASSESSPVILHEALDPQTPSLTSQPEEKHDPPVDPDEVKIEFSGNDIKDDPKYIPTEKEMKEEDPGYPGGHKNQQEEQIRDTVDAPPPPPVGSGDTIPDSGQDTPNSGDPSSSGANDPTPSEPDSSAPSKPDSSAPSEPDKPSSDTPVVYEDGWQVIDGKRYFYKNGRPTTGWETMSGRKYFFDDAGVLSSQFGIDVSVWQGDIDWKKVKNAGVEFVYVRCGYRGYGTSGALKIDKNFEKNIKGALAAGLDCGVYFYSQAITRTEAVEEAKFVLEVIKGYTLTLPIAFDIEKEAAADARTNLAKLTNTQRTDICIDFCDTIKAAGYYPMIYSNKSWLLNQLQLSRLSAYDTWLAHFTNMTDYKEPYRVWQYTESGSVDGIKTTVDLNVSLIDFPSYLRKNGYNHL